MARKVRVSLANKCQLLFGAAVVLIISAALGVVWFRLSTLVEKNQESEARSIATNYLDSMIVLARNLQEPHVVHRRVGEDGPIIRMVKMDGFAQQVRSDPFFAEAIDYFRARMDHNEYFDADHEAGKPYYRYARAVRLTDIRRHHRDLRQALTDEPEIPSPVPQTADEHTKIQSQVDTADEAPAETDEPDADVDVDTEAGDESEAVADQPRRLRNPVQMVLLVRLPAEEAAKQLMVNRIIIIAAGLVAGLLAIVLFWFITMRIILSPVRVLQSYAEQVSKGDLNLRSDINTGDEFEQLSDVFNTMLESVRMHAEQLRATNKSLDLKLGELAETNVALYEANKIKGEFLANVSHELRTPLNSIIGFAEVLGESIDPKDTRAEKNRRYAANIVNSSRQLLELINDLLDLAKIEAGRMEVRVTPMSVQDVAEGLVNLMRPQAEKKQVQFTLRIPPNLPIMKTDPGKVQQILFNLLSNAVKFSPEGGTVTLAAQLIETGSQGQRIPARRLRLSVADEGPGIAEENHERIFEKFTQIDQSATRTHSGTGLGLTISRDLASLLHGEIRVESELGEGATFILILPLSLEEQTVQLMPDLTQAEANA